MTEKERLLKTLQGENADRPACICPGGMMNMVTAQLMECCGIYLPQAHTDAMLMADLAEAVYTKGCFENVGVPFCMTVEAERLGAKVNMGSQTVEPHISEYVLNSVCDWQSLHATDVKEGRAGVVLEAIRLLKEKNLPVPVIGNLTGPVSTAASVVDPNAFYKELRKKNEDAHAYMDFITKQLIEFGLAQIDAGADVIAISDPSGTGEIMGPKYFAEFTVKYLNQLIAPLKAKGAAVIVHICGQMRAVYEQMNEIQSDALSFDAIVPMSEARRALPGRVLMGNVSTYTLEFGDPEKIRTLTQNCVSNGADIISPACGLGMKSPLCNIQAMLDYLKEQG